MRKNRFTEALLVTTLRKADEMPSRDEAWRERSDDLHATQAFRVNVPYGVKRLPARQENAH